MSYYQPVKPPSNQPVNRETDYQRAERHGRYLMVAVVVLVLLVVGSCISATSGTPISCDAQGASYGNCAP